jgi:3-hydroxyisobutyrate dehydrogenase-like beta-hydroxyacid dehydrogenase
MRVGFVGLGRVGARMAAGLSRAGHRLAVYNRMPAKADRLIAQERNTLRYSDYDGQMTTRI